MYELVALSVMVGVAWAIGLTLVVMFIVEMEA